jgi:hypothetical protein
MAHLGIIAILVLVCFPPIFFLWCPPTLTQLPVLENGECLSPRLGYWPKTHFLWAEPTTHEDQQVRDVR